MLFFNVCTFLHLSSFVKGRKQNLRALKIFIMLFLMPFVNVYLLNIFKDLSDVNHKELDTQYFRLSVFKKLSQMINFQIKDVYVCIA